MLRNFVSVNESACLRPQVAGPDLPRPGQVAGPDPAPRSWVLLDACLESTSKSSRAKGHWASPCRKAPASQVNSGKFRG